MSIQNKQFTTNIQKRSFIKTLIFSLAFISFGGIGSLIKNFVLEKSEDKPSSGFGSNGYGM